MYSITNILVEQNKFLTLYFTRTILLVIFIPQVKSKHDYYNNDSI